MAGLNFQTCTVLNAFNTDEVKSQNGVIRIKGHGDFTFESNKITRKVYKKADDFTAEVAEVTLNLDANSFYRIEVLVDTEGAQPVVHTAIQNPVPFWTEFATSSSVNNIAKDVENLLKKSFVVGNQLFDVVGDGTKLTITAKGEYLRIKGIKVYKLDYVDAPQLVATGNVTVKGVNGFGTYSHLIKDLRLPSVARVGVAAPHADEMPVVGAKYTQFIIDYTMPAPHTGMQAVGQKLENTTTHVFWVKEEGDNVSNFANAFGITVAESTSLDD